MSDTKKVSLLTFFLIWAKRQGWQVPLIHVEVCHWLEHRGELAVLRCFRGFGKSTILAIYNAWCFYQNPQYRILHQSETDGTARKTSRDTKRVLIKHPLTKDLFSHGGVDQWWIQGNDDERNASVTVRGILSNVTSARADECQNDDVEVPRNTTTPEAREKMREALDEQTHILVPGGKKLYIGTPHTYDSLYDRIEKMGADCLTIKMFKKEHRISQEEATKKEYQLPFKPDFILTGIGQFAKGLKEGTDYKLTKDNKLIFNEPPNLLIDCYAGIAWPERFPIEELEKRRKETETINKWDSQYQLHAKPVTETRLDPDKMKPYNLMPMIKKANNAITCWLGDTQIVGAIAYWDCSLGKVKADASAFSLVLTDAQGQLYWQVSTAFKGELAEFDDNNNIIGGQAYQVRQLAIKYNIPCVVVETNGVGGFVPPILRNALKGTGCAVREHHVTTNKQQRILDALEPPLQSSFLWVHKDVLASPAIDQMRSFNPTIKDQPDDYIDSLAGAILQTPVRIARIIGNTEGSLHNNWRPSGGTFTAQTDY